MTTAATASDVISTIRIILGDTKKDIEIFEHVREALIEARIEWLREGFEIATESAELLLNGEHLNEDECNDISICFDYDRIDSRIKALREEAEAG